MTNKYHFVAVALLVVVVVLLLDELKPWAFAGRAVLRMHVPALQPASLRPGASVAAVRHSLPGRGERPQAERSC